MVLKLLEPGVVGPREGCDSTIFKGTKVRLFSLGTRQFVFDPSFASKWFVFTVWSTVRQHAVPAVIEACLGKPCHLS